jgi:hypothetical protein
MTASEARKQGWEPQPIPQEHMPDNQVKYWANAIRDGRFNPQILKLDGEWEPISPDDSMFAENILLTEKVRGL